MAAEVNGTPTLRNRLEKLEDELKILQDRITLRRLKKTDCHPLARNPWAEFCRENNMTVKPMISPEEQEINGYQTGKAAAEPRLVGRTYKSVHECKKNLLRENHRLRMQINSSKACQGEIAELKKKLKEEVRKRLIAEKQVAHAMENWESDETVVVENYEHKDAIPSSYAANGDGVDPTKFGNHDQPKGATERDGRNLEKKYIEEKEKRIQLEAVIGQYQEDMNAKRRECAEITVGQKLALALAEQFKSKCEKNEAHDDDKSESYLLEALKSANQECLLLQDEISKLKKNPQVSEGKYKERALKAELELETLRNNREKSTEDEHGNIQETLNRQRNAYSELLMAKKCAESEYKSRCQTLESEVARLHGYYEKRIAAVNERLIQTTHLLQQKMNFIENLTSSNGFTDTKLLEKRVSDLCVLTRQKDLEIAALNEKIADKGKKLDATQREMAAALKKVTRLNESMNEMHARLAEKSKEIEKLLAENETMSSTIAVKEKLLNDKNETIETLKRSLREKTEDQASGELDELMVKFENLKEENRRLISTMEEMGSSLAKAERYKEGQEKNAALLRELEKQVRERQIQWEEQLSAMSREKDQAIVTAKFATKKLVSAVGEYETQLNAHKQLHHLLKESLKEKDQQLQTTINNLEKMRTQAQRDNSIPRRADVIDDHFNLCRTH